MKIVKSQLLELVKELEKVNQAIVESGVTLKEMIGNLEALPLPFLEEKTSVETEEKQTTVELYPYCHEWNTDGKCKLCGETADCEIHYYNMPDGRCSCNTGLCDGKNHLHRPKDLKPGRFNQVSYHPDASELEVVQKDRQTLTPGPFVVATLGYKGFLRVEALPKSVQVTPVEVMATVYPVRELANEGLKVAELLYPQHRWETVPLSLEVKAHHDRNQSGGGAVPKVVRDILSSNVDANPMYGIATKYTALIMDDTRSRHPDFNIMHGRVLAAIKEAVQPSEEEPDIDPEIRVGGYVRE